MHTMMQRATLSAVQSCTAVLGSPRAAGSLQMARPRAASDTAHNGRADGPDTTTAR